MDHKMHEFIKTEGEVTYGILTLNDFKERVWRKVVIQDDYSYDKEKYASLRYIKDDMRWANESHGNIPRYAFVIKDDTLVAVSKIMQNGWDPKPEQPWGISFTEVMKEYRNKGYASKLMQIVFDWAKQNDANLHSTSYTKMGHIKLKPLKEKLSKEYGVEHNERNEKHGWHGDINKPARVKSIEDDYQDYIKSQEMMESFIESLRRPTNNDLITFITEGVKLIFPTHKYD